VSCIIKRVQLQGDNPETAFVMSITHCASDRPKALLGSFMPSHLRLALALALLMAFALPTAVQADWTVYVEGTIGISTGSGQVEGLIEPATTFDAKDRDSSPMLAGAVGLSIPMNEAMAWELPYDLELPEWPIRPEIEFAGLRQFEYVTPIGNTSAIFLTSNSSWAMMINNWFDVPMRTVSKPLAWTFQTRRTTMDRILEPITFNLGVGIGMSAIDVNGVSTADRFFSDDSISFAWQVGTGFSYEVTPFVSLGASYRYFKATDLESTLVDNVGQPRGDVSFKENINEFRFAVRVNVYSFTSPWDRLK